MTWGMTSPLSLGLQFSFLEIYGSRLKFLHSAGRSKKHESLEKTWSNVRNPLLLQQPTTCGLYKLAATTSRRESYGGSLSKYFSSQLLPFWMFRMFGGKQNSEMHGQRIAASSFSIEEWNWCLTYRCNRLSKYANLHVGTEFFHQIASRIFLTLRLGDFVTGLFLIIWAVCIFLMQRLG